MNLKRPDNVFGYLYETPLKSRLRFVSFSGKIELEIKIRSIKEFPFKAVNVARVMSITEFLDYAENLINSQNK